MKRRPRAGSDDAVAPPLPDVDEPSPQDVLAAALLTAHDINNMLMVALLELDQDEESSSEGVVALREAARLSRDLVRQYRRPLGKPSRRHLQPLVERAIAPLHALLGPKFELSSQLERVGAVRVDAPLVDHLVRNLVLNARQACPDGGPIVVKLEPRELEDHPWASLQVIDVGAGIAAKALAQLGRRTVRSRKGNGIALALLRTRVAQLGGELVVHSDLGRGTSVEVLLPCLD